MPSQPIALFKGKPVPRPHTEIVAAVKKMREMIAREICDVELPHWGESVFRYFFVRALLANKSTAKCDAEWHRIDLLVRGRTGNQLVEFKYFTTRVHESLDHAKKWKKGGPGPKNFGEFRACVAKLARIEDAKWRLEDKGPISGRYIILAYCDRAGGDGYSDWYRHVERNPQLNAIAKLTVITAPEEVLCKRSQQRLTIKLLQVENR
jgi:hypothetical protein